MKQTKLILLVAVIIAAFSSCKDNAKDLADAIPSSAMVVIHFDTKSILKKSDYSPLKNEILKKAFDEQKNRGGERNKKTMDELEKFMKDPNSFGVSFVDDCFIYTAGDQTGILWNVNDAKKLKNTLTETMGLPEEMLEEADGVTTVEMPGTGVIGWTANKLLVLMNTGGRYSYDEGSEKKDAVIKQLKQKSDESINSVEGFSKFVAQKKDISVFYAYDNYVEGMEGLMSGMLGTAMGANPMEKMMAEFKDLLKGVSAGAFISFEKGAVTFNQEIYYASSESEKKYKDLMNQLTNDLKGEQLKYFAEKPIIMLSAGMKGEGVYDYMTKLGIISMIEENSEVLDEMGLDLKSLVANLEGDVTIALNNVTNTTVRYEEMNYEYTKTIPEATLLADMKDASILWKLIRDKVAEADEDSVFVETSPTSYTATIDGVKVYLGIKGNLFYITNQELMSKNIGTDQKNDFASLAKGNKVLMYGNLNGVRPLIMENIGDDTKAREFVTKGLSLLGDYSFVSGSNMSGSGKIVITDDSANSLAVATKFFDEVISYYIEENM